MTAASCFSVLFFYMKGSRLLLFIREMLAGENVLFLETGPVLDRAFRRCPLTHTGMIAALDFVSADRAFCLIRNRIHVPILKKLAGGVSTLSQIFHSVNTRIMIKIIKIVAILRFFIL